ncbi:MAG: hypothetical protein ACJ8F7_08585 [Gemmataceae bacterium]
MLYCESPTLEEWIAPPQEDFPRPTWTKLLANGSLLSNSLEYANWLATPVEPMVCEGCWNSGCSGQGLAKIVRLSDQLLWLPPRLADVSSWLNESSFIRFAVLMPVETWERLRAITPRIPPANSYAKATRADIAGLWLHEIPKEARIREVGDMDHGLRSALASDPLDMEPAKAVVKSLIDWIRAAPDDPVQGRMVRANTCGASINTFYFDGYEWPSFLVGLEHCFVCGEEWAFVEGPLH